MAGGHRGGRRHPGRPGGTPGGLPHQNQSIPLIQSGSVQPFFPDLSYQSQFQVGVPVQHGIPVGAQFASSFRMPWDGRQQLFSPPEVRQGMVSPLNFHSGQGQFPGQPSDLNRVREDFSFHSTAVPMSETAPPGLNDPRKGEESSGRRSQGGWHVALQPGSSGPDVGRGAKERREVEISGSASQLGSDANGIKPKQVSKGKEAIPKVDKVAIEVYGKLLDDGKGVTVKKVVQSMLSSMASASLESLGLRVQDIPCLRQLASIEAKVNASIQAYVMGRKLSTLHDMICEICKDEGIKEFGELGLGPPHLHPLVIEYFSPDTTEYCKITATEVVSHLAQFLLNRKKSNQARVDIQDFLDFVAKSKGVATVQHLCLRVQSLGLYIGSISKARNEELKMLRENPILDPKGSSRVVTSSEGCLSKRIDTFFSSAQKEAEASITKPKHTYLQSASSSDDESQEDQEKGNNKIEAASRENGGTSLEGNLKPKGRQKLAFSHCPYPSEAEERLRTRKDNVSKYQESYAMSDKELADFIAAWKGACHNSSTTEVLEMMLQTASKTELESKNILRKAPKTQLQLEKQIKKKIRKLARLFKSHPAIGLLNVAVLSMKLRHWDSMYDHFQEVKVGDLCLERETRTAKVLGAIKVDYKPKLSGSQPQKKTAVTAEQLLSTLVDHFDHFQVVRNELPNDRTIWGLLRWVIDCEKHTANLFSGEVFTDLGFNGLVDFLEHHLEALPNRILKLLRFLPDPDTVVPQQRLVKFCSQAVHAFGSGLSVDQVLLQLSKQFGVQAVKQIGKEPLESIVKKVTENKLFIPNDSLFFARALGLKSCSLEAANSNINSSPCRKLAMHTEVIQDNVGSLGSKSSLDAWQCLLKAPMLGDLKDWSKWDVVFAPSLGPFLDWFENEERGSRICVLIAGNGAVLRIRGTATADDFLAVTTRGSGRQIAETLVSLVAAYGGVANVPVSLLRTYARKALGIRTELFNSTSHTKSSGTEIFSKRLDGKFKERQVNSEVATENLKRKRSGATQENVESPKRFRVENSEKRSSELHNAVLSNEVCFATDSLEFSGCEISSECVLDCLFAMPSEFRVFAAQIFLHSVYTSISQAALMILKACRTVEHHLMLHGIGFELGILEWIADYESYVTTGEVDMEGASHENEKSPKILSESFEMLEEVDTQGRIIEYSQNTHSLAVHNKICTDLKGKLELVISDKDGRKERNLEVEGMVLCDSEVSSEVTCSTGEEMRLEEEAQNVIKCIRCEEFGIEQESQSSEDSLLARQHARMGRALHCLSRNLYSEDCHFVLELVQNADDNRYPEGVDATLVFIVQQGHLVVLNNEIGFTEANIRALCDIGKSTKSGSNAGYIGHKGIGFKSVFRVTDSPQIHSNGFHVKFDSSLGDIGFILPTIVPTPSDDRLLKHYFSDLISNSKTGRSSMSWNTRIDLPLKSSIIKQVDMKEVSAMFNDLHPTLMLFLHKLRRIIVRNDLMQTLFHMERLDVGSNLVKLTCGASTNMWLVVRKTLEASVSRVGITSTEIALAFPLSELPDGSFEAVVEQQKVFAFLPLRSYGLRFILQADFILPSSREEVDHNSAWNQWLLSEIPPLFVQAADSFRFILDKGVPGRAIRSYMTFVPIEGEVVGFFSSLPRMILSVLRSTSCLPIQDGEGACALPCVLLKGWDDSARRLLPDSLLREHTGLYYLDAGVILPDPLASNLGVQSYGLNTLLSILKSVCVKEGCLLSLGLSWIHHWLLEWHKCSLFCQQGLHKFVQQDTEREMLKTLQSLPFIALSNGTFCSASEGSIWFTNTTSNAETKPTMKVFSLLYSDLRTVHPEILRSEANLIEYDSPSYARMSCPMPAENAVHVRSVLLKLGVRQLSEHDVIMAHILPRFSDLDMSGKDKLLAAQYLAFVMLHFCQDCRNCALNKDLIVKKLQSHSTILTSKGLLQLSKNFIHFPVELGNKINVKEILSGLDVFWPELDPVYLQYLPSQWNNHCRSFFEGLGITDFLQVVAVEKIVCDKSVSVWKDCPWEPEYNSEGWIVEDWECSELSDILEAVCRISKRNHQCASLLLALDMQWKDHYYQFSQSAYRPLAKTNEEKKLTESTFVLIMRQYAWIKSSQDEELHVPTELFVRCDSVDRMLGKQAPYAVPEVQSIGLAKALGLRTTVSVSDIYELFRRWNSFGGHCQASIAQMARIYSFLSEEIVAQSEVILRLFNSFPCVFIPEMLDIGLENPLHGKLYHLSEVFWSDPTGSLDILDAKLQLSKMTHGEVRSSNLSVKPLCKVYPNLHAFFIERLHVQEQPCFDGYLSILAQISAYFSPNEAMEQVFGVFKALSAEIDSGRLNPDDLAKWKSKLKSMDARIFPTMQKTWVSLNERNKLICWCDDVELLRDFEDLENHINFIVFSKKSQHPEAGNCFSSNISLISFLDIPRFSELVEPEIIAYGSHNADGLKELFWWVFPYAQRYLKQLHPDLYEMLSKSNIDRARKLEVLVVDQLFISYRLRYGFACSSQRRSQICSLQDATLYVSLPNIKNYSALYLELSRLFFGNQTSSSLANFLHLITLMAESGSSESSIDAFVENNQGISPLPDSEVPWAPNSSCDVHSSDKAYMLATSYLERHCARQRSRHKAHISSHSANVWPPFSSLKPTEIKKHEPLGSGDEKEQCAELLDDSKSGLESNSLVSDKYAGFLGNISRTDEYPEQGDLAGEPTSNVKGKQVDLAGPGQDLSSMETAARIIGVDLEALKPLGIIETKLDQAAFSRASFSDRDILKLRSEGNDQQLLEHIGRSGEAIVFQYLAEKHGRSHVKWLNENSERGAPFDIIIDEGSEQEKFVEVKTTSSLVKDWFEISFREWEFAKRKREKFSIYRVFLGDSEHASAVKLTELPDPVKLCLDRVIQLALILPQNQNAVSLQRFKA